MSSLLDPKVEDSLKKHGLRFEVIECEPDLADTAAFCEAYGYKAEESANSIIVASRKVDPPKYAICVVLASTRLDVNKAVTKQMGVKRASFADGETTKRLTGMEIGGVVAIGIEDLPILIDASVMKCQQIIMGGGNRSSKLILKPAELLKLPNASVVENLAN